MKMGFRLVRRVPGEFPDQLGRATRVSKQLKLQAFFLADAWATVATGLGALSALDQPTEESQVPDRAATRDLA